MTTLIPKIDLKNGGSTPTGAINRPFNEKLAESVSVKDFGAKGDGSTNDTTAINNAIASGKSVYFPAGTYMTTGGHSITYPSNQSFYGDFYGSSIIKKISGTNTIFDIAQYSQCAFDNLTIDGNSLGGKAFMWRAHYSTMSNMFISNIGGTTYAVHISGANLCNFSAVNINNGAVGDWYIDQSTDPLVSKPTYGMYYSTFNHCSSSPAPGASGSSLLIGGATVANITFSDFYFETSTGSTGIPIHFNNTCSNVFNVNFNQPSCEVVNTNTPIIYIESSVTYNISFSEGNFGVSAARTDPIIKAVAVEGLEILSCNFNDLFSTAPEIIRFDSVTNGVIKDCGVSCLNNFTFYNDYQYNNFITLQNNNVRGYAGGPGLGTNTWNPSANQAVYSSATSSQFTNKATGYLTSLTQLPSLVTDNNLNQLSQSTCGYSTVAAEGYFDVYGNGGTVAPGTDFIGVLTITGTPTTRTVVASTANNFATLYAQSGQGASAQAYTAIAVGSNVEVDVLADNTAASLATTTAGKLGVQIGGGSFTTRFIRIYNRTGASIVLNVDVKAFK